MIAEIAGTWVSVMQSVLRTDYMVCADSRPLLLISLRFEREWWFSMRVIKLLPQDSEHASRLRTRIMLTHVRSEVKLTVPVGSAYAGALN